MAKKFKVNPQKRVSKRLKQRERVRAVPSPAPSIRKGIFDKSKAIGCLLDFILIALVSFLVCSVIWKVFFNDLFLF